MHGRAAEKSEIDRILAAAETGRSAAVVVSGEAGIGKSALLDYAAASTRGQVLRAAGVESEMRLPFAGLHLLLHQVIEHVDRLPAAQAAALLGAFGQSAEPVRDRFLVGLATLTLLSDLSEAGPVLCLVDDAQWLDSASFDALTFAARRLDAESVVMVFATRDSALPLSTTGLPELRLDRLNEADAGALLTEHAGDLAPHVRRRILDEAAGNPLALLEFPAALTPDQRGGRLGPLVIATGSGPPAHRVQKAFQEHIRGFSDRTRRALLVAAADETADLGLVLRASLRIGATLADLEPAEQADLVQVSGGRLDFRHPLVRTAAYQAAPHFLRIAAHKAIAAELDGDPDRRAWHLAASVSGTDEAIADVLEQTALRAKARSGAAAASTAFERSAELTVDQGRSAVRLVSAATLALQAGQLKRAAALAERAVALLGDDPGLRADLDLVLASVEFEQGRPDLAGHILVEGVLRLRAAIVDETRDDPPEQTGRYPSIAQRMLLGAAMNASFSSDPALAHSVADGLRELGAVEGLHHLGFSALAPGMRSAARLLGDEAVDDLTSMREGLTFIKENSEGQWNMRLLAATFALMSGDDVTAVELSTIVVAQCRELGMIGVLPQALALSAQARMLSGDLSEAAEAATEALDIARHIGQSHRVGFLKGVLAWLAAISGDAERCESLVSEADTGVEASQVMAAWATGFLHLGQGRPQRALECLAPIWHRGRRHQTIALYAAPELIEAAVRADRPDLAKEPMSRLEQWAGSIGSPWSAAVVARSRALLAPGEEAGRLHAEAVRIYAEEVAPGQPLQHARAELLYGEWLRRAQRRTEARAFLEAALVRFERLGAAPWAERARAELRATGASTASGEPGRTDRADRLTPQESQVVQLAATGLSNREIGSHLFLSPRTVSNHLYRAFPKLGITSRDQLADLGLDGSR